MLAKIDAPNQCRLGNLPWQMERSIAWLRSFQRFKIHSEGYDDIRKAFLSLACALIRWTRLMSPAN